MQAQQEFLPRAYSVPEEALIPDDDDDVESTEIDTRWARYCAIARGLDRDELLDTILEELREHPTLISHIDDACLSPYEEIDRPQAHMGEMAQLGLAVLKVIVGAVDNAVGIRMATEDLHAVEG